MIESYFAPPLVFSLRLGGWFASHFNRMLRYRHFVDGGAMVGTDPTGVVSLNRKGRWRSTSSSPSATSSGSIAGTKTLSRIYLGGGALRVFPSSYEFLEIALRGRPRAARRAHQAAGRPLARLGASRRAATR